jgi:CubicO group peptidase (beta-lactamase class C family)
MRRVWGALALSLGCFVLALSGGAASAALPSCKTDLESELEELELPGLAAAIVKDGRIVCASASGFANIAEDRPVTPETLFLVASISKTVTATALMQLYEQGKFQLDDDINDYLSFQVRNPWAPEVPITFRQLLTHTSSIRDSSLFNDFLTKGMDSPITLAELLQGYLTPDGAYYHEDDNFQSDGPGESYEYTNMNFVLIGYLVEVMSGVPFDKYCRDNIFAPLGMEKTTWRLAEVDKTLLAMPYRKSFFRFVRYGQYGQANYPDGMLRTSVVELARFLIAYMQGGSFEETQILGPETVREMLSSQTELDDTQGLAWYTSRFARREVWGHNGSDIGAGAEMWFDPASNEGVILVSNRSWDGEESLVSELFREADGY